MAKKDIDEIVLIGGSTRIIAVQKLLEDFFDGKVIYYYLLRILPSIQGYHTSTRYSLVLRPSPLRYNHKNNNNGSFVFFSTILYIIYLHPRYSNYPKESIQMKR